MMSEQNDLLEAAKALTGYIWHLLETYNLMPEGHYTFPDGETWTVEELEQWKKRYCLPGKLPEGATFNFEPGDGSITINPKGRSK
jgi:hypothetical protein